MNLMSAIVQSCDVYFYRVAEMMDVDVLAAAADAFGYDNKTGIDLPIEVAGNVPTRRYYDKRHGKGRWTQGLMLNNVIGQGEYLVNRVARCPHVGGRRQRRLAGPSRISSITFGGEARLPNATRTKIDGLDGDDARVPAARHAAGGGEARWYGELARIPWLRVAGKTGTAQNPHGDDHSWYTAYAPADNPQIAVALIVENAGHGSEVAGPIVRNFLAEYFRADKPAPGKLSRVGEGTVPLQVRHIPAGLDSALSAGVNW